MIKKKIRVIITFMCISTLGIVFAQFLWVNNVIHINEKQFDQNVYAALKNIVLKLEKQSYAITLNGELIDIHNNKITSVYTPDTNKLKSIVPINEQDTKMQNSISIQDAIDMVENNSVNIKNAIEEVKSQKSQIKKTINNFDEIANQLKVEIQTNKNPLERLNLQLLDSIIYKELLNIGIKTNYEFAVVDINDDIIFKSDNFKNININSRYRTNLFPTDATDKDFYLILDVPLSNRYGFNKSFYHIFIFSVLITFIVTFIFFVTVRMILKQKKLDEIKTDFINNITHELKTPIASLKVAIQTLKQDKSTNKNSTINLIERQGNRLQIITERVIDSSFNNIPNLKKQKVVVKDYLLNLIKDFEVTNIADNIKWSRNLVFESENEILIDLSYFTTALNNIFDNAIRYNNKSEKIISIKSYVKDQLLNIEIEDNGIGISNNDKKRVFEKFYRGLKGNLHNEKGLGIGLFISKQIIELHDGKITFISNDKLGTTFYIKIPIYE